MTKAYWANGGYDIYRLKADTFRMNYRVNGGYGIYRLNSDELRMSHRATVNRGIHRVNFGADRRYVKALSGVVVVY